MIFFAFVGKDNKQWHIAQADSGENDNDITSFWARRGPGSQSPPNALSGAGFNERCDAPQFKAVPSTFCAN